MGGPNAGQVVVERTDGATSEPTITDALDTARTQEGYRVTRDAIGDETLVTINGVTDLARAHAHVGWLVKDSNGNYVLGSQAPASATTPPATSTTPAASAASAANASQKDATFTEDLVALNAPIPAMSAQDETTFGSLTEILGPGVAVLGENVNQDNL